MSGTGLYAAAGFGPLAFAGVIELAKGACGPLLAGRERKGLRAGATALAIVGHNWSPVLSGQGGRGVSLALGATAVAAPEGAVLLVGGLAVGKLAHATGVGTFVALGALPLLLEATRGRDGALFGAAVVLPILAKRLLGNDGRLPSGRAQLAARLFLDREVEHE